MCVIGNWGFPGLGLARFFKGALGVNVVGGSLCMGFGADVLWELEVSGRDALRGMHLYQHL